MSSKSRHNSSKHRDDDRHYRQTSSSHSSSKYRHFNDKKDSRTSRDDQSLHELTDPMSSSHIFYYERHKYELNKMFFLGTDVLKIGTKEYDELWSFVKRYQSAEEKAIEINKQKEYYENIGIKLSHLTHKIPVEWTDISVLIAKTSVVNDLEDKYYVRNRLSRQRVEEFRNILVLYLDFLDKQKVKALEKLKQMQMDLPIYQFKDQILEAIENHSVVLIAGDTGCGKSTQVPQYLLGANYDKICCSQPRRIACISLRKRVAYETHNEFGTQIGHQIRFERNKSKDTKILFITEGLLLRQVITDPMLSNYNVIILDEVHERHLSCDFLLGVMKCLVHKRSNDLKVILMSATINIKLFSDYFGKCPVIEVPGRLYPIDVQYFPIPKIKFSEKSRRTDAGPYLRILQMIDDKYDSKERGDLLVFLSGLSEINSVGEVLKDYARENHKWIILCLHSTLSIEEQDKVFDVPPESVRKCILSTNIAETSLTIDGIRFVCDSGKVKEMSFDVSCRMQRLQEFWISIASAEQRKGRAGRTGPGVCYRLYSEKDFYSFERNSQPEIRRVPLHSLLLQMISMGLPDARKFPFLEPPDSNSIEEAIKSLKEQSALTDDEELTPMGKMLSRLPVDITIGKMLILSSVFNLTEPILSLAAALSVQSPITNQSLHDRDAIEARRSLNSPEGDPFTLLNAYNKWLDIKSEQQNSRKWCKHRGLEEQRFYEMTKLRQQFKDILKDAALLDSGDSGVSSYESSADRIRRFGELKHLRKIKREYERKAPKQRKMLKMDGNEDEDHNQSLNMDVKDIEFRLSHDVRQVQTLRNASRDYSNRDITLMKLILSNGLHPQLTIGDEHNTYRPDSDQMFHTKDKPFVTLHPNGVFAIEPDLLRLSKTDEQLKGFSSSSSSSGPVSSRYQLIAYVSLLETTKPYLCNCVRIPAAHVLLLVSNAIDTDYNLSRIVCDGWLELQFTNSQSSQKFILQALQVRDLWHNLLYKLFDECFDKGCGGDGIQDNTSACNIKSAEVRQMQSQLVKSIYNFIRTDIAFSIKRLLAADIKQLYIGSDGYLSLNNDLKRSHLFNDSLKQSNEYSVHPIKGGLQIKPYLTYNCLTDNSLSVQRLLKKEWKCEMCGQEMLSTPLEQIRHIDNCKPIDANNKIKSETNCDDILSSIPTTSDPTTAYDPMKIVYNCNDCKQQLLFTSIEILRHKRSHQLSNTENL
ncbi:probable ATP-dependent RNA helicase DHX34 [Oppia nitens]|uniref:probable ATP-dependent RNA helicase DHX34 n=1 Tax=Oppia nitens TaxID=1686743 RepID=UPI0023D9AE82|nr:probable ATP-dependent RNA helicase DHX34 [Oppia nitens]